MKGRLVSNTGPIIALSSIDQLKILKRIFEEVIVPETVHNEIGQCDKDFSGLGFCREATWIKVQSLTSPIEPLLGTRARLGVRRAGHRAHLHVRCRQRAGGAG